jgi:hypothetical protein
MPIRDGNSDLEDIQSFVNYEENNDLGWTISGAATSGYEWEIYVSSINRLTGATTLVQTVSGAEGASNSNMTISAFAYSYIDDYAFALMAVRFQTATTQWTQRVYWAYSTDNWSTYTQGTSGSITTTAAEPDKNYPKKVVKLGSYFYFISTQDTSSGPSYFTYRIPIGVGAGATLGTDLDTLDAFYQGVPINDEYWFVYYNGTNLILSSYDGSAYTTEETLSTLSIPASFSPEQQLFWQQGNHQMLIDSDYFRYRRVGETDWSSFTGTGEAAVAIVWDRSNSSSLKINFIIWKGGIYKVEENGRVSKIQQISPRDYKKRFGDPLTDLEGVVQWGTKRIPDLSDLTVSTASTDYSVGVVKEFDGMKNPLQVTNDDGTTRVTVTVDQPTATFGKVEFYIGTSALPGSQTWQLSDTGTIEILGFGIRSNQWQRLDNIGWASIGAPSAPIVGQKYHIVFIYECTAGSYEGLSQYTWKVELDGVSYGPYNFRNNQANASNMTLVSETNATFTYTDAIGNIDSGYTAGDNQAVTAYVGWRDFFTDGDDRLYLLSDLGIEIEDLFNINRQNYQPPNMTLNTNFEPFLDQYIEIYDGDGQLACEGQVLSFIKDREQNYLIELRSGIDIDLSRKITEKYTSQTISAIIQDVIDDEADYIHTGKGDNGLVNQFTQEQAGGSATGWTNSDGVGCTSSLVEEKTFINGVFKKVLSQEDTSNTTKCDVTVSTDDYTVVSGWFGSDDTNLLNYVIPKEDSTTLGHLRYTTNNLYWLDSVGQNLLQAATNNEMVHFVLVFNATDDTVDIYLNGVFNSTQNLLNNITNAPNGLLLATNETSATTYTMYTSDIYFGDSLVEAMNTYNSLSPLVTTTYSPEYKGWTMKEILQWADAQNGYISTFNNNDQLYHDQFRPSPRYINAKNVESWGTYWDPDLTAWTDASGTGCTVSIKSEVNGKKDVLTLDDQSANSISLTKNNVNGTTSGEIYFKIRATDTTKGWIIYLGDSFDNSINFQYDNGSFQYRSTAGTFVITSMDNDIWYSIKITYDFSTTWTVLIDGVEYGPYAYRGTPTVFDYISMITFGADTGYTTYIHELGFSWDDYTPASKSLRSATDANFLDESNEKVLNEKVTRAIIYGGFDNGEQLVSIKFGEPGFGTLTEWKPTVVVQTELDALATQIIADRNIEIQMLAPVLFNLGTPQMGEYFKITSTGLDLDGTEDWIINKIQSSASTESKSLQHMINMSDVFYQGKPINNNVKNNEQAIGYLAKRVRGLTTLSAFIEQNQRNLDENLWGLFNNLSTANALNSGSPINDTAGCHRIMLVVNAGSDTDGTITITGNTRDRTDTSSVSAADTEVITINGLSTDNSTTDAQGNTIHAYENVYMSDKWFEGSITISTTNVTLTDVDVYGVLYHQFDSYKLVTLETFDFTGKCTNTLAWMYLYLYIVNCVNSNKKYDIENIAAHDVTVGVSEANEGYRRRKIIRQIIDGNAGQGVWAELFFGPAAATYWQDVSIYLTAVLDSGIDDIM